MQRWPAAPKPAPTSALSDCSLFASGITTAWFFAPIMHCTRLPCVRGELVDVLADLASSRRTRSP